MPTPTIPTAAIWHDKRSVMLMAHLYRRGMLGQPPVAMGQALRRAWAEEKAIARQRHASAIVAERQRTLNLALLEMHGHRHATRQLGAVYSGRGIPKGDIQGSRF